ncbi:VCBS repeat-containing protein [Christiangramia crocea]|uniref:VCBS repeat-containing protein n=1 Tax=Christiangramia crocea TaxID=2904124 RepID=A0A9X1UUR2_9FLAO|nr:VCBS repeat-containing protein [Gramella crocea]MCG9970640.1 VCBS repeat-containing protein [Gramella crocea]
MIFSCNDPDTLFKSKTPKETGINFSNELILSNKLTVLEFEYMYNGAGVAVADFDLDGLLDIYFTANMSSNKLYRNLGDWKFEDITIQSNTNSTNWSNGVAIVDINQDQYPDIYVSRAGPRSSTSAERSNLLFINNGKKGQGLTFTESAAEWGLNDDSYSVQASFFDYDLDGDLDMYLLCNALVDFNRNTSRPKDTTGKAPSVDKLFRNNGNNTFTDVSNEAQILVEGFGLGVEICDLNMDGWPDIYVSNDFLTDDILYINQKDGTFKNQIGDYFEHLTFNGMGNDISDINNDGLSDVVVLDMLPEDNKRQKLTMMGNNYDAFQTRQSYGYQPQYIRNTLQLNNGNGSFSEIGQLSGISATEWSWSALFADFDQDGFRDLFVTNGYRQDITNLDFMVYGNRILTMGTEEANRKERLKELNKLPGIKIKNYFYRNTGDLGFENNTDEAGIKEPTYSNGMAYGDFDNDGDLDLVINNIDDPAGLFENQSDKNPLKNYIKFKFKGTSENINGLGSKVEIRYDGKKQFGYNTPYRGYLSSVEPGIHFGLGNIKRIDTVIVTWPDGKKQLIKNIPAGKEHQLSHKNAEEWGDKRLNTEGVLKKNFHLKDSTSLDFTHREDNFVDFKVQPLLPHMHSRNGPGLSVGDINGDGLEDCFIGGAAGQAGALLVQQQNREFTKIDFQDPEYEDMGSLLFDADNDGDQDMYVVSGGSSFGKDSKLYEDRFYENDGTGKYSRIEALPKNNTSGSVVTAADYDRDGLMDIFVGGRVRPGEYPMIPKSMLLNNKSKPGKIDFSEDNSNSILNELGMVTAALWTDFNNDNWPDLIVVGEFMPIRIFQNNKGVLKEIAGDGVLKNSYGWWNSINSGDFDEDGDVDYVLGNFGLNNRYNVSIDEPLRIHAKDYDKNGQIDPIMSYYINGENYIGHSRNDLIKQINAMRGRFRNYTDYAEVTFKETFLKQELEDAYVVKSQTFANSYLENLGNGKFKLSPLPKMAQISPMYGTIVGDYNNDNHLDVLAVGNFYSGEVFSGQYDASIGWFLAGDGKGNLTPIESRESGFFVKGDAKSLVNLRSGQKELILAGINNGPMAVLEYDGPSQNTYYPKQNEVGAIIKYPDNSFQKFEFSRSSGYLSQPSLALPIPKDASSLIIIDNKGNEHEISITK